jgi:hypothetical protein
VGVGEKVVADPCATVNGNEAMQHGMGSDSRVFIDKTVGADVRT